MNTVQLAYRLAQECRAQVTIALRHSQVFVIQDERDSVKVSAAHSEPTRRSEAEIVKSEVPEYRHLQRLLETFGP